MLEGHAAATQNDYLSRLEQISQDNSLDPNAFTESAQEIRGKVLASASPEIKDAVSVSFDRAANSYLLDIQKSQADAQQKESKLAVDDALSGSESTILRLVRQGDDQGAIDEALQYREFVQGSSLLSADEKRDRLAELDRGIIEQASLSELDQMSIGEAYSHIEEIRGDVPDGFSPDEWNKFISRAQAELNSRARGEQESRNAITELHARDVSNLEIEINSGAGDAAQQIDQIERLFERDVISGSKRTSLLTKINDNFQKVVDDSRSLVLVTERLNGDDSIIVDPTEIDDVYAKHFAETFPQGVEGNAHRAAFVERLRHVPKQVVNEIKNGLRSGNPELTASAADLIDRIEEIPGLPETSLSKEDKAFARVLQTFLPYSSPEEAINIARKNTDPSDQARIQGRRDGYSREFRNAQDREEFIIAETGDRFDEKFFGNSVDALSRFQLAQDFDRLSEEYFVAGMDLGDARDQAEKDMKRIWGASGATGKTRSMKYPPEMFYGVGDNAWMNEQLIADVESEWGGEHENILIRSDDITAREASTGKPSYIVVIEDEKGLTPLVGFRWRPDASEVREQALEENEKRFNEKMGQLQSSRERIEEEGFVPKTNASLDAL